MAWEKQTKPRTGPLATRGNQATASGVTSLITGLNHVAGTCQGLSLGSRVTLRSRCRPARRLPGQWPQQSLGNLKA
eukprot:1155936-Rhodomonas_salina.1